MQVCICRKEGGGLHRHLAFLPEDSLDGKNIASTRFSQKLTYSNYCVPFFGVKTGSKNSFSEVFREKGLGDEPQKFGGGGELFGFIVMFSISLKDTKSHLGIRNTDLDFPYKKP